MGFEPRVDPATEEPPLAKRVFWMVAIWLMSVGVLGTLAYLLRLWLA